jgi:hypothetical protein
LPSKGNFTNRDLYFYDHRGNNSKEYNYSKWEERMKLTDTTTWYRVTNKHDINGNLIKFRFYLKGYLDKGNSSIDLFYKRKYNTKNELIEEIGYNSYRNLTFIAKYRYDSIGNIIEEKLLSPSGDIRSIETFEYDYDLFNNWIKRISFKNYIPQEVTIREIEYY